MTLFLKNLNDGRVLAVIGVVKLIDLAARVEQIDAACAEIGAALEKAGLSSWAAKDIAMHLRPHVRPSGAAAPINTVESAVSEGARDDGGASESTWDDVLELNNLTALGLSADGDFVVQDLLAHGYIPCRDIRRIPVRLHSSRPQVLLIADCGMRIAESIPRLASGSLFADCAGKPAFCPRWEIRNPQSAIHVVALANPAARTTGRPGT